MLVGLAQEPPGAPESREGHANSNGSSGNESQSHDSLRSDHSSSGNGKDSALLETTESSKSTNSQSLSPPSSSIAYSLLSTSSEQDNPSTSGCSSEQSARVKTQKELMKALKEMKIRLPSEKRGKGQSGTLATLQYALSCVKQVQGTSHDYYQQWTIDEGQPCALDVSSYTIEELESITSEYTLKNPDTFAVAVSFVTGKILYISDQAAFILRCKRDVFKGATFAEFLAPQDVSIFYGSTAPYHLPSWSACTSASECPPSGGRTRGRELCYSPFRLTPYLAKVRPSDSSDGQPCCLLIAERIHSGYEAPRIPPDKRIFTTRHTPSCLFQDVDERAAPLLGYLPQDLIGTPVLFYLHPEDRPLMLAIHKKILQYGGQPFDHSPPRFCTRNGEYATIDTSWARLVHRHKVRTGPLNEDVFTAPKALKMRPLEPDVQELSEQIHRLLLQVGPAPFLAWTPFHYPKPSLMTFQQFCKDVHMVKSQGQQVFIESRVKPPAGKPPCAGLETLRAGGGPGRRALCEAEQGPGQVAASEESLRKEPSNYSYQQINCLDGIIRYLQSCNIPSRVKRKCGSSSYTGSSHSDDDKQKTSKEVASSARGTVLSILGCLALFPPPRPPRSRSLTPVHLSSAQGPPPPSLTPRCLFEQMWRSAELLAKLPLGDDIVMMEEGPGPMPPALLPSAPPDREQYRRVGLTKEVLSTHTQHFKDLSRLHVFDAPAGRSQHEGRGAEPGAPCRVEVHTPVAQSWVQPCSRDGPGCWLKSRVDSCSPRGWASRALSVSSAGWDSPAGCGQVHSEGGSEARGQAPCPQRAPFCLEGLREGPFGVAGASRAPLAPRWLGMAALRRLGSCSGLTPGADVLIFKYRNTMRAGHTLNQGSLRWDLWQREQRLHLSKRAGSVGAGEQFIRYVLQDPIWLLMANSDEKVMLTYQLPSRPMAAVLQEDREKLKQMQKQQPRFTEEQKRELAEVHPWMKKGLLPKAINIRACVDCGSNPASRVAPLYDVELPDMDLSTMLEPMEEGSG
uniref:Period circadian regulator 1 n=1 Tax=Pelodiscus sinensis TaxID=13735 RepID=K7FCY7_PELSI